MDRYMWCLVAASAAVGLAGIGLSLFEWLDGRAILSR